MHEKRTPCPALPCEYRPMLQGRGTNLIAVMTPLARPSPTSLIHPRIHSPRRAALQLRWPARRSWPVENFCQCQLSRRLVAHTLRSPSSQDTRRNTVLDEVSAATGAAPRKSGRKVTLEERLHKERLRLVATVSLQPGIYLQPAVRLSLSAYLKLGSFSFDTCTHWPPSCTLKAAVWFAAAVDET